MALDTRTFELNGKCYAYLRHAYNGAASNERTVEVSLGLALLMKAEQALEVGAVLPHYLPAWPVQAHAVIDLQEDYPAVTKADVLAYAPAQKVDLVLSISTLEHLGTVDRVHLAILRMLSWLDSGGKMFITLPHGAAHYRKDCTPGLDEYVHSGRHGCRVYRMDKVDVERQLWVERPLSIRPLAYGGQSKHANTLYLLSYGGAL